MDITYFVSELLFEHECVIIPDFGGFVTHYVPARIHPINHTFYPPSKNVLFNSKLTRDDGLLLDFIAQKKEISYAEAKSMVIKFTDNLKKQLFDGNIVRIANIGTLNKDPEGSILFEPDESVNYYEDAFGLTSFISPAIIRKPVGKRLEAKFIDRKPVPPRERKKRKAVYYYLALIPVLLLSGWLVFFGDLLPGNTQKTGMVTLTDIDPETDKTDPTVTPAIKKNNPPLKNLDFTDPGESKVNKAEIEEAVPEQKIISKKYYIIGGAFGVELNADKFVAVLRNKGYEAERAGLSPSGFHMVSYYSTPDKNEAMLNLAIIRRDDNPSAWLLKQ